jgi:hypothetical protein
MTSFLQNTDGTLTWVCRETAPVPFAGCAVGRAILADMVGKHPEFAQWKTDLAWFDARLAALK